MPLLQFRGVYVPLILDGRKTQTIRAKLGGGFVAGRPLRIQNGYSATAHVADATIDAVDEVPIAELTERDAKLDGFPSLAELLTAIAATYPGAARVFRVRWRDLVPAARAPPAAKRKRAPARQARLL